MSDTLAQILLALLPSVVVFLTAYHLMRQMVRGRAAEIGAERAADQRREDRKQSLPLRLQAYERLALFAERIQPGALVLRVHKSNMTSRMLHSALVATIREEFEHNVTQQIFVGDKVWAKVRQAKEETIRLVNLSYEQTGDEQQGTELSRRIFDNMSKLSHTPSQEALVALKEEVRRLF
jgi:predicted AlkP superfamily phosphohydrolase/phosphomutase